MKKLLVAVVTLIVLAIVGVAGYFGYTQVTQSKAASTTVQTGTELPSSFTNPFVEKPSTGFSKTESPVVNPFAQSTTQPINPFASTQSGSRVYQNPFEQLR